MKITKKELIKIFIYNVLTQLIIIFGKLREILTDNSIRQQRIDRTFYCSNNERWTCCDCGLEHLTKPFEEIKEKSHKFIPVRIKGYCYQLRLFGGKSSPTIDERIK